MLSLKKVRNQALLLAGTVLFPACETSIEVPVPEHTPKLAVRCTIGNEKMDSALYAYFPTFRPYVSHSQSILSTNQIDGINNATVVITDGSGTVVETFKQDQDFNHYYGNGYYNPVTNFTPQAGQQYTFTVSAPGYETVSSTLTLPNQISGIQGSYLKKEENPFNLSGRLTFTIPDKGNQNNYYLIYGVILDDQHNVMERGYFSEEEEDSGIGTEINDIHFSQAMYNDFYSFRPFDDKTFNGTSVTVSRNINISAGGTVEPKYLRLMVSSLTEDYFKFLKSLQLYYDSSGNPFAEPAQVRGNIKNGYGCFGGYTNTYIDIPLR